MARILLHPCYFGPVSAFVAMASADEIWFENEDNYQKQTYRNRMYIYGANGRLSLTIPIRHTGKANQHQKYKEVRIENHFKWQQQHWKSLQTVYRTSPFFEFYEDEFLPLYQKEYTFLMDFNYDCLSLGLECLQMNRTYSKTTEYQPDPSGVHDLRSLVEAKKKPVEGLQSYHQVFQEKHGFLQDLCIVDLIFNQGPAASDYLRQQNLFPF